MLEKKVEQTKPVYGIVLVDMQPEFLNRISDKDKRIMIPAQKDVLKVCSGYDFPVVVLEYEDGGDTIMRLKTEVTPIPRRKYMEKSYDDGFKNTNLADLLVNWDVNSICLMGVNATGCVRDTAESALKKGFEIITAGQLIADPPAWDDNKSIDWYNEHGVYFGNYHDLLSVLLSNKP